MQNYYLVRKGFSGHFIMGSNQLIRVVSLLLLLFPIALRQQSVYAQNSSITTSPGQPAAINPALPHGEIVDLWPSGASGAIGNEEQDKPHLEIFGESGPGQHTAVIVCSGGGYSHLAYDK